MRCFILVRLQIIFIALFHSALLLVFLSGALPVLCFARHANCYQQPTSGLPLTEETFLFFFRKQKSLLPQRSAPTSVSTTYYSSRAQYKTVNSLKRKTS